MKTFFTLAIFMLTLNVWANYQIRSEKIEGVTMTQTMLPDKSCVFKGNISVGIHGVESVKEKLAKEAKKQGGNFVFIRMESSFYSYKYGGELYQCD